MAKYLVYVKEIHSGEVQVDAESPEQARELANEFIQQFELVTEYSSTTDPETWDVIVRK